MNDQIAEETVQGWAIQLRQWLGYDVPKRWIESLIAEVQASIEKVRTETLAECRAATEQQICDLQDRIEKLIRVARGYSKGKATWEELDEAIEAAMKLQTAIIQSAIDQVRTETLAECRAATEQQICDLQDRAAHASEQVCDKCGRVKYGDHGKTCYHCDQPAHASELGIAKADAEYVLRWMKQCKDFGVKGIPDNIVGLQERVCDTLRAAHASEQ